MSSFLMHEEASASPLQPQRSFSQQQQQQPPPVSTVATSTLTATLFASSVSTTATVGVTASSVSRLPTRGRAGGGGSFDLAAIKSRLQSQRQPAVAATPPQPSPAASLRALSDHDGYANANADGNANVHADELQFALFGDGGSGGVERLSGATDSPAGGARNERADTDSPLFGGGYRGHTTAGGGGGGGTPRSADGRGDTPSLSVVQSAFISPEPPGTVAKPPPPPSAALERYLPAWGHLDNPAFGSVRQASGADDKLSLASVSQRVREVLVNPQAENISQLGRLAHALAVAYEEMQGVLLTKDKRIETIQSNELDLASADLAEYGAQFRPLASRFKPFPCVHCNSFQALSTSCCCGQSVSSHCNTFPCCLVRLNSAISAPPPLEASREYLSICARS
jgi:hypothetical protein